MKRHILIFTLLLSTLGAAAQDGGLFIKAGGNLANITTTDNGNYSNANNLLSFHAGLTADLALSKFFAVQPSLLFTGKGSKTEIGEPGDNYYVKTKFNPYYVELPVNLVAKIPLLSSESNVFFGAGPYLAMGVGGKYVSEGTIVGSGFKNEASIEFSEDDPTTIDYEEGGGFGIMKRFDYGLNATAGFQLKSLLIGVNYGIGLAKLNSGANNNNNNNNEKNKHRVLSVSLGVKL